MKRGSIVPDYQYHTFITIHLNNPSKDVNKDRLDDINYRQQITQKISSYLIKFFVKNASKSNYFPVQYVYEKKSHQRWHLHILIGRLDPNKCLFNKLILEHLEENLPKNRVDYDLIDSALKFVFKRMKLNGHKIVMNGKNAFDIRRVWDIEGVSGYVSKYSKVRYLFGPEYEYEPFHSIQVWQ